MDKPLFESDRTYTRRQLFQLLGGDVVSNFPQHDGRVIYCCFNQNAHREAPELIFIGAKGQMSELARNFATQTEAVPVFLKQRDGYLVYQGMFVAERYSENRAEIVPLASKAYKTGIAGVLFLQRVIH